MEGDVESQEQFLEPLRVLELDLEVFHRLQDLVVLALDLEVEGQPAKLVEGGTVDGKLDLPVNLAMAVPSGRSGGGSTAGPMEIRFLNLSAKLLELTENVDGLVRRDPESSPQETGTRATMLEHQLRGLVDELAVGLGVAEQTALTTPIDGWHRRELDRRLDRLHVRLDELGRVFDEYDDGFLVLGIRRVLAYDDHSADQGLDLVG